MPRVACSLLVCLSFLWYVQCQENNGLESSADLDIVNLKSSRTSNQELGSYEGNHSIHPRHTASLHLSSSRSSHRGRTRRQVFGPHSKNTVQDPYSWSHTFTTEWNSLTYSKDSTYIYNENTKRLKHVLEKNTQFLFLNPSCLRISIPADSINLRIEEFRIKLNDEFRDNNDGQVQHIMNRVDGRWNYYIPRIHLEQGDKLYYKAKVKFSKEGLDATVTGLLEVTMGNPHAGGPSIDTMPHCSAVVTFVPNTQPNGDGLSSRMGDGQGAYVWKHQFSLNSTAAFTKDSVKSWLYYADFLKNLLEKHVEFKFLSPTGLMISIPDNNANLRVMDLHVKKNQEFWENDGGHYVPNSDKRDSRLRYYIPDLKVVQGDRVFYRMKVKLGKEAFDAGVYGVLQITMGNPHVNTLTAGLPTSPLLAQHYQPHISQVANSYTPVSGGQDGGKGGQAFSWDHKFISINVNSSKGGFTKDTGDRWLEAEDNIFKQKDIDFQFLNPTGLNILLTGNDKEVLDFQVRLNQEFKTLVPGEYGATVTRFPDGRYNYFYPTLKLKNGDKLYYWMRVVVGKEMWDYNVKGKLEISKGNPHSGSNQLGTISSPILWPTVQPARVDNSYQTAGNGLANGKQATAFKWEHRFTIDPPVNGGFTQESLEDTNRLKNTLEKDIDFQFINPTGLKISISGEDKGFRILAFNMKVNEKFENLEPGDYVANITRMQNGRWSHYYQNLKVNQGDKIYYWMRLTFGKGLSDSIVRGEVEITRGNPHKAGPIAELSPPNIVTQTQQSAIQSPANQFPQTQTVDQQNNYQPPNQVPPTQTPIPQNIEQAQNTPQTPSPVSQTDYQPPNQELPTQFQVIPTQIPVLSNNSQPPSQTLPVTTPAPLNMNQPSVSDPMYQTDPCVSSESNPQCVKVQTHLNPDGQHTHEVTIGGEHPLHISIVQVTGDKDSSGNVSKKS